MNRQDLYEIWGAIRDGLFIVLCVWIVILATQVRDLQERIIPLENLLEAGIIAGKWSMVP